MSDTPEPGTLRHEIAKAMTWLCPGGVKVPELRAMIDVAADAAQRWFDASVPDSPSTALQGQENAVLAPKRADEAPTSGVLATWMTVDAGTDHEHEAWVPWPFIPAVAASVGAQGGTQVPETGNEALTAADIAEGRRLLARCDGPWPTIASMHVREDELAYWARAFLPALLDAALPPMHCRDENGRVWALESFGESMGWRDIDGVVGVSTSVFSELADRYRPLYRLVEPPEKPRDESRSRIPTRGQDPYNGSSEVTVVRSGDLGGSAGEPAPTGEQSPAGRLVEPS